MKDLLGRGRAIEVDAARRRLLDQKWKKPQVEQVPLLESYGRVLAEDVTAPQDLPGFDRSTMDGYAVYAGDTFGASDTMPVYLQVRGRVRMGMEPDMPLERGQVMPIPTGGMLPRGADAVVMLEYTNTVDQEMVEIMKTVSPGENVVRADEDVKGGEIVLAAGRRLRPQDVGALAGLGIVVIRTFRRPVVSIIGTGDEVVAPDQPVSAGRVRDVNSYNLAGLIRGCHAVPRILGIVRDDLATLRRIVEKAVSESDMVLISGGSSVGTKDFTSRVIGELGSPGVLFHGVAVKPGKPLIGGLVRGVPVFGLPGHPAAITVCFETLVEPLLVRLSGATPAPFLPSRRTVKALFGRNLSSSTGREEHVRVSVRDRGGTLWAVPVLGKSGLVRTLVEADGIVVIPMNKSGLYEGEEVEVRLF